MHLCWGRCAPRLRCPGLIWSGDDVVWGRKAGWTTVVITIAEVAAGVLGLLARAEPCPLLWCLLMPLILMFLELVVLMTAVLDIRGCMMRSCASRSPLLLLLMALLLVMALIHGLVLRWLVVL